MAESAGAARYPDAVARAPKSWWTDHAVDLGALRATLADPALERLDSVDLARLGEILSQPAGADAPGRSTQP